LRIQFEGALYHITCRGNERREIFRDEVDRNKFLEVLEYSLNTYHVLLYCFVLMDNHYHLLVETPLGNLSEFMRHFNITYTSHYNRRHSRVGHLYQGRYKGILVEKDAYLSLLSRYIHLNPVRVGQREGWSLKEKQGYLKGYPWSSLPGYLDERKRFPFIDYDLVLEEYGGDNRKERKGYWVDICRNIAEGLQIKDKVVGQMVLGGEGFVRWVKGKIDKGLNKREIPSVGKIISYRSAEDILEVISGETGKACEEIIGNKGILRQLAMELLYKYGGLKGVQIGELMGVDYSTVSQGRKRLRQKLEGDKELEALIRRIEIKLSTINRLLKNAHLLRFSHPSSLRCTSKYASLLRISRALHLNIFEQPAENHFFNNI